MKRRICMAQIGFVADIRAHIDRLKDIIVRHRDADLIVFPELILHGHPSIETPEGTLYRQVKKFYKRIAGDSDDLYRFVATVGARVIIGELRGVPGSFSNVATYIDGTTVEHYAKTHIHWTENFLPGRRLRVFQTPMGKVGVTICFDGAFAEVWRVLALQGAAVIVNISATPRSFSHDYILRRLKGAAISNQVYVVYVNRPDKIFSGHSVVIDPRGEIVLDAGDGEQIVEAEIDLASVAAWREEEQIYGHRRPLLYRDILKRPVM